MGQICEICGERQANVFYVDARDERCKAMHLCDVCYEQQKAEAGIENLPSAGWTSYTPPTFNEET